jgi:hypothetical protein
MGVVCDRREEEGKSLDMKLGAYAGYSHSKDLSGAAKRGSRSDCFWFPLVIRRWPRAFSPERYTLLLRSLCGSRADGPTSKVLEVDITAELVTDVGYGCR